MLSAYQADNDLLHITDFHVHRIRANLISFWRTTLLNFFGKVDPKLSVYIPDIEKFIDRKTNRSIYKFADAQKSLITIQKWWEEEKRGIPYIILVPGPIREKRNELSGDNLHFEAGMLTTYGGLADTEITFYIGAGSDQDRTQLGDLVYTACTQFLRKNFVFTGLDGDYFSILVKNDSIGMSGDGQVQIGSSYEAIYTVAVGIKLSVEWQYTVDYNLTAEYHYQTDYDAKIPVTNESALVDNLVPTNLMTPAEKQDVEDIQIYLYSHIDDIQYLADVKNVINFRTEVTPQEGERYIETSTFLILTYISGSWEESTPISGNVVFNITSNLHWIFVDRWIGDKYHLIQ